MPEAQINTGLMKSSEKALSQALTSKAQELKVLPMDCHYECHVQIGPDGKPTVVCGVNCSG